MTPDSNNLYLGAGDVLFDRFASGAPTGLRHLGNVSAFDITMTVTTLEKRSDMQGVRGIYRQVVTGTAGEVALTLDEYDPENMALALLGSNVPLTQTATATVTDQSIANGANLLGDVWYSLGAINPTITNVKQSAATLDPQAYTLDAEAGLIKFLSAYAGTGKFTSGQPGTWSGSIPAIAAPGKARIDALAISTIVGHLHFKSAADQASGPRLVADVWNVTIHPDGALKLISTEWGAITLKGQSMPDQTRPVGQQYFRIVYL